MAACHITLLSYWRKNVFAGRIANFLMAYLAGFDGISCTNCHALWKDAAFHLWLQVHWYCNCQYSLSLNDLKMTLWQKVWQRARLVAGLSNFTFAAKTKKFVTHCCFHNTTITPLQSLVQIFCTFA